MIFLRLFHGNNVTIGRLLFVKFFIDMFLVAFYCRVVAVIALCSIGHGSRGSWIKGTRGHMCLG